MNIFMIQQNYQSKYLVKIDGDVYVYKMKNVNLINHFSLFNQNTYLLVNQKFVP